MNERIVDEYCIATSSDGDHDFSEIVEKYLKAGWSLHGSPKYSEYASGGGFWYQAMVKYSNKLVEFHGNKDEKC